MSELDHMHENISGIYNYCDRWCEKCSYTNRCLLFKREAERDIKHILNDEDPNDPEVFAKDIADSIMETYEFINKKIEEEDFPEYFDEDDFDFDDEEIIDGEENPPAGIRTVQHSLIDDSLTFFKEFNKYYNLVKSKYPEEAEEKEGGNNLSENLSVIAWYSPQINVKSRSCIWGKNKLTKVKNEMQKEIELDILNVNSRIAFVGIEKCINALTNIYELKQDVQQETLLLLSTAKKIKEMIANEFPNVFIYKRPYFD